MNYKHVQNHKSNQLIYSIKSFLQVEFVTYSCKNISDLVESEYEKHLKYQKKSFSKE
jgi:hypothetical protein